MKKFRQYVADQDPAPEFDLGRLLDDPGLMESAVLDEAFSSTTVKTAAVAILVKMSSLRQQVLHDRAAGTAQRSLAEMIFLVGSMVGMLAGGMKSDAEMVSAAKRAAAR